MPNPKLESSSPLLPVIHPAYFRLSLCHPDLTSLSTRRWKCRPYQINNNIVIQELYYFINVFNFFSCRLPEMFQITRKVHLGRNIYSDFVVFPRVVYILSVSESHVSSDSICLGCRCRHSRSTVVSGQKNISQVCRWNNPFSGISNLLFRFKPSLCAKVVIFQYPYVMFVSNREIVYVFGVVLRCFCNQQMVCCTGRTRLIRTDSSARFSFEM